MECKECKLAIDENCEFCPYCGTRCGAQICEKCGNKVEDDYIFCSKCGQSVNKNIKVEEIIACKTDPKAKLVEEGSPSKFYLFEKNTGTVKNGIIILLAAVMLRCSFVGGSICNFMIVDSE